MSGIWPPMSRNWDCILQCIHIWKRMKQYAACLLCGSVSRSASAPNYCCSELVYFQAVWFSQGQMIHQPKQRGLTFNPNSSLPTLLSHCLSSVSQWNTTLSIRKVFCSLSGWRPLPGTATSMDYDCHAHLGIRSSASDFSNHVETEPRCVKSAWGGLLK